MSEKKDFPNIIFILSDDQGPWALGCAGNDEIKTPNLDHLAQSGIRFENFFCTSPVCSPARASIFTGRIPSQHGVHDWIREGNVGKEGETVEYLKGQRAFTDILAEKGYKCGFSGKWHLGKSIKPQKSFSHWYVHQKGGGPYFNAPMIKEGELINEAGYVTDAITDDALNFLSTQEANTDPFYLSIHYTAPHSPWDEDNHPDKYLQLYQDCAFDSIPEASQHPWQREDLKWGDKEYRNRILKGYYAAVTAMDENIGRIIDKIDNMGIRDNTLIIFSSDNGMNMGHHGIIGKGNGTFPQNMYDTSVKVPTIISPPNLEKGKTNDSLLSQYDFLPTILDYVGIEYSDLFTAKLPGRSFAPLLQGEKIEERERVVVFDEYGPVRMIRNQDWKYIHRYPYGPHELYHLKKDPEEKNNLIDNTQFEERIIKMRRELNSWFNQYVNPEIEGLKEPVFGEGQLGLAGVFAEDKDVFSGLEESS